MPQKGKIPGVTPAFLALVSQGEKQFPWCQYFSFNHDSASYIFVELRCVGISGALADSDNEQVFFKIRGSDKYYYNHNNKGENNDFRK